MAALETGTALGSFELGEVLSELAYGTVYEARRSSDGLRAAVTVVAGDYAEFGDEFLAAAEAAQGLVHAHLVTIHECGRTPSGAPWSATDLLSGSPLSAEIDESGKLSEPRATTITKQILSALEALHGRDVVHEGLSPNSIVLTETAGDDDHVRLLCFGTLAKLRLGAVGDVAELALSLGEVRYGAPEQLAEDGEASDRSDIYAAGLILLEMLTGHPANDEENLDDALARQLTGKLKLDAELTKRPITKAMALALVKDPAKRFRSAAQFREALDRIPGLRVSKRPLSLSGPGSDAANTGESKAPNSLSDLRARLQLAKKKSDDGAKAGARAAKALAEAEEQETDAPTMLVGLDALRDDAADSDATMQVGSDALEKVNAAAEGEAEQREPGDKPTVSDKQSEPSVNVGAVSSDAPVVPETSMVTDTGDDSNDKARLDSTPIAPDADGYSEMSLADAAASISEPEVPNVADLARQAGGAPEGGSGSDEDDAGAVANDGGIPATMATMAGRDALIPTPRPDPEPSTQPEPRTDDALVVTERQSSPLLLVALVLIGIVIVVLLFIVFSGEDGGEEDTGDDRVAAEGSGTDSEDGAASSQSDEEPNDPADDEVVETTEGEAMGEGFDDTPVDDEFEDASVADDGGLEMDFAEDDSLGETPPEAVTVALATTPEGARVTTVQASDGKEPVVVCEATPCEVTLKDGMTTLEVAIELDGHESQTTVLAADSEPVALALAPIEEEAAADTVAAATEGTSQKETETKKRTKKRRKKKKRKKEKDDNPFGARTFD